MSKKAFTMVEMLVCCSIFASIFGLAAMVFAYATRRTGDGLALNNLIGQVQYIDQYLEKTIENAESCKDNGLGSTHSLQCTMPSTGVTMDDNGVYVSFSPISSSLGILHWGTGNNRWFYWSNSTGGYNNNLLGSTWGGTSGNRVWMAEVTGNGNPSTATSIPAWNCVQGTTTSAYRFYLIDTFTFHSDDGNKSVTYTVGGSVRSSTNAPLNGSTDLKDSHSFSITRTVYWHNEPS